MHRRSCRCAATTSKRLSGWRLEAAVLYAREDQIMARADWESRTLSSSPWRDGGGTAFFSSSREGRTAWAQIYEVEPASSSPLWRRRLEAPADRRGLEVEGQTNHQLLPRGRIHQGAARLRAGPATLTIAYHQGSHPGRVSYLNAKLTTGARSPSKSIARASTNTRCRPPWVRSPGTARKRARTAGADPAGHERLGLLATSGPRGAPIRRRS